MGDGQLSFESVMNRKEEVESSLLKELESVSRRMSFYLGILGAALFNSPRSVLLQPYQRLQDALAYNEKLREMMAKNLGYPHYSIPQSPENNFQASMTAIEVVKTFNSFKSLYRAHFPTMSSIFPDKSVERILYYKASQSVGEGLNHLKKSLSHVI